MSLKQEETHGSGQSIQYPLQAGVALCQEEEAGVGLAAGEERTLITTRSAHIPVCLALSLLLRHLVWGEKAIKVACRSGLCHRSMSAFPASRMAVPI